MNGEELESSSQPAGLAAGARVLLTGATGFLGGHLLLGLQARGYRTRVLLREDSEDLDGKTQWLRDQGAEIFIGDLGDAKRLQQACRGMDGLIHSAAVLGGWSKIEKLQYEVNVDATAALYRAALTQKLKRVVHVSTIATVGATRKPRLLTEGEPWSWEGMPKLHYVKTKREAEERALHAVRNGLPVVVVNPTAMVGPRARDGHQRGLVTAVTQGGARRVPHGGASFAHVADVAESIVTALERGRVRERYLLGGPNLTWAEFHGGLARRVGLAPRISHWPTVAGRAFAAGALVLDVLGLSRPRFAPERFRAWGWYGFVDSSKAQRELGHPVLTPDELFERAVPETAIE